MACPGLESSCMLWVGLVLLLALICEYSFAGGQVPAPTTQEGQVPAPSSEGGQVPAPTTQEGQLPATTTKGTSQSSEIDRTLNNCDVLLFLYAFMS